MALTRVLTCAVPPTGLVTPCVATPRLVPTRWTNWKPRLPPAAPLPLAPAPRRYQPPGLVAGCATARLRRLAPTQTTARRRTRGERRPRRRPMWYASPTPPPAQSPGVGAAGPPTAATAPRRSGGCKPGPWQRRRRACGGPGVAAWPSPWATWRWTRTTGDGQTAGGRRCTTNHVPTVGMRRGRHHHAASRQTAKTACLPCLALAAMPGAASEVTAPRRCRPAACRSTRAAATCCAVRACRSTRTTRSTKAPPRWPASTRRPRWWTTTVTPPAPPVATTTTPWRRRSGARPSCWRSDTPAPSSWRRGR